MNRRTMLASLMAGPGMLASSGWDQQASELDPTLYIPRVQRVEDLGLLQDVMDRFSFVELVTVTPTLRITHIPTVLDRTSGKYGTILAHVSAQNPQRLALEGGHRAVMVFRGPHGYISPTWYAKQDVVPTWNFAVIHVSGHPRVVDDHAEAYGMLTRLVEKSEASVGSTGYAFDKLPDEYVAGLMKGIVSFRMEIEAVEGKFKLGHERSEADREGLLSSLRNNAYREPSLYEVTEAFHRRPQP